MVVAVTIAVVGVGSAVASWAAGRRASRPDVTLDSDTIESRFNWTSDVVAVVVLATSSAAVCVWSLLASAGVPAQTLVAGFVLAGALVHLWSLLHQPAQQMNRYPETLHPTTNQVVRRLGIFMPGLCASVAGELILVAAAALWPIG